MPKYKTVGILGGMGPEATAELYLRIIRIFQQRFGARYDSDFPEFIIASIPIPDVVERSQTESDVRQVLIAGAKKLEQAGASFIVIPCNTVTKFLPDMQNAVGIPIINIVKETARGITDSKVFTIGLLATEMTIRSRMYERCLEGTNVIIPNDIDQQQITQIILGVLSGRKTKQDRKTLYTLIRKLKRQGADRIVLGCTELPLLVKGYVGIVDTLDVLAEASVREAVRDSDTKQQQMLFCRIKHQNP